MSDTRTPQVAAVASPAPAMLERVSWGAVIAGAVIALAVLMVLNLIGLAMGLYAVDASSRDLGAGGAATLTGIWWAVSALFALFIGGWISSKLAGNPDSLVSGIHGAAVWAAATLLAIFAVSSAMSAAFTGAAGIVGRAAQTTGQAATQGQLPSIDPTDAVMALAAQNLAEELQRQGVQGDPNTLRQAADAGLRQAISPAERQELATLAQQAAGAALQNPDGATQQFSQFTERAFGSNGVIGDADRAQAAQIISQQTGAPASQVRTALDSWQAQYVSGPQLQQQVREIQAGAARTTEQAAGDVAGAALWTALGLVLALVAAVGGGMAGRPRTVLAPRRMGEPVHVR